MRFAKVVFWMAGIWGVLELVPLFFLSGTIRHLIPEDTSTVRAVEFRGTRKDSPAFAIFRATDLMNGTPPRLHAEKAAKNTMNHVVWYGP
jgi:hypothetical protein